MESQRERERERERGKDERNRDTVTQMKTENIRERETESLTEREEEKEKYQFSKSKHLTRCQHPAPPPSLFPSPPSCLPVSKQAHKKMEPSQKSSGNGVDISQSKGLFGETES